MEASFKQFLKRALSLGAPRIQNKKNQIIDRIQPSFGHTGVPGLEPEIRILEIRSLPISLYPQDYFFISLCIVCLRQNLQNFFNSNFPPAASKSLLFLVK